MANIPDDDDMLLGLDPFEDDICLTPEGLAMPDVGSLPDLSTMSGQDLGADFANEPANAGAAPVAVVPAGQRRFPEDFPRLTHCRHGPSLAAAIAGCAATLTCINLGLSMSMCGHVVLIPHSKRSAVVFWGRQGT